MRKSIHPAKLAYLRLPFIDLFNAVKHLYKTQNIKSIQTYRGGFISEFDCKFMLKNKGKYIEMLGFMSTS